MSAGELVGVLVVVGVLVLLCLLTVLLAKVDRMLSEARQLVADLGARPGAAAAVDGPVAPTAAAAPAAPEPAGPEPAGPEPAAPGAVAGPVRAGSAVAVRVSSATGPTLAEVATATLGPPLVRAAALGHGVRAALAARAAPAPARTRAGSRPIGSLRVRSRGNR